MLPVTPASGGVTGNNRLDMTRLKGELPALVGLSAELHHAALEDRLESVLDFARRHAPRLHDYEGLWTEQIDPFVSFGDKVVVETALLALTAARTGSPAIERKAAALAAELAPYARSQRNRGLLLRYPHTATSLGIAHVALMAAGSTDQTFDDLLGAALTGPHAEALERLPFRAMELRWLRGLYERRDADHRDLLDHSILSTRAHPIHMSSGEAYALPHALMYLTDFGAQALPTGIDAVRCSEMLDENIAWHLVGENLDLLGECLLGIAFVRRPWSGYACVGWRALAKAWSRLGFLPSPSFDVQQYARLEGDRATAYVFRHTYHTLSVAGMLCAVLLRHPERGEACTPDVSVALSVDASLGLRCRSAVDKSQEFWRRQSRRAFNPGIFDARSDTTSALEAASSSLAASPTAGGRPEAIWRETLAGEPLDETRRASVLFDGLLIHSAREYELASLAAAIIDVCRLNLPLTSTTIEVAEFLLRQQLPSGAIGAHLLDGAGARDEQVQTLSHIIEMALAEISIRLSGRDRSQGCLCPPEPTSRTGDATSSMP